MTRMDHASPVEPARTSPQADTERKARYALYTAEERKRRDESVWTLVQGVLAPVQFLVFLISLVLVIRTLNTGEGAFAADVSIVVKTFFLYTIMITGAIWEKVVFGKYLFAEAFFWEDVFSMLVIALHTLYMVMLLGNYGTLEERLIVALAGYGAYVINAGQFIWKLRMARLQAEKEAELSAAGNAQSAKGMAVAA
jgi:3-vinyl bacteriochlorophyllide hydratase